MTGADGVPAWLTEWARSSGPDRVLGEARSRLESLRLGPRSSIAVPLTPEQRRTVGKMLGAAWAQTAAPVPVKALRSGLEQNGCTLEQLLRALDGELVDRPAARRQQEQLTTEQRAAAVAELRELLGLPLPESAQELAEAALDRWVLRRYPARERAAEMRRVVTALPDPGEGVLLPVLAARVARDAHALDRTRPLGRAVARFLAIRTSFSDALPSDDPMTGWVDPVGSGEAWRAVWAGGGVACDTVSSQVLVLNLPLTGDAAAVRLTEAAGSEPVWLSLRSLSGELSLAGPTEVFVCENPSILESAADRLGERCAPLVCTFGRPGLAAIRLLRAVDRSATLRIRADGDAAGWGIMATLGSAFPEATPWLMPPETTAYEEELVELLLADLDLGRTTG